MFVRERGWNLITDFNIVASPTLSSYHPRPIIRFFCSDRGPSVWADTWDMVASSRYKTKFKNISWIILFLSLSPPWWRRTRCIPWTRRRGGQRPGTSRTPAHCRASSARGGSARSPPSPASSPGYAGSAANILRVIINNRHSRVMRGMEGNIDKTYSKLSFIYIFYLGFVYCLIFSQHKWRINPVTKTGQRLYMVMSWYSMCSVQCTGYSIDDDRSTCFCFPSSQSLLSSSRMPPL